MQTHMTNLPCSCTSGILVYGAYGQVRCVAAHLRSSFHARTHSLTLVGLPSQLCFTLISVMLVLLQKLGPNISLGIAPTMLTVLGVSGQLAFLCLRMGVCMSDMPPSSSTLLSITCMYYRPSSVSASHTGQAQHMNDSLKAENYGNKFM